MYYSTEPDLIPGTVVTLDPSIAAGVKRSSVSYDKNAVGIVSTKPGFILSDASNATDTPVLVALSGRVPVLVSTENGDIAPGDLLTTSATPGYAMKATKAGQVIGQAMTGLSGQATGTVGAFIKTSYYNGTDAQDLLDTENATTTVATSTASKLLSHFMAKVDQLAQALNLSEVITDRLSAALEVITPKIFTSEVATNKITAAVGNDISVKLSESGLFTLSSTATTSLNAITFDAAGNGDFMGMLTAQGLTTTADIFAQGNLAVNQTITVAGSVQSEGDIFTNSVLRVGTTTDEIFHADSINAKVSIGTSTANATFFVQGKNTNTIFTVASSTGSSLFSVIANGSVGIGTSSPLSTLTVQGASGASPFTIASSTGDSLLTVNENGFIGVGTSTALALFDVWGSLRVGTGTLPTLSVNTATNIVGIGNNGTAVDGEMLRVSGRVRATGFDIDQAADFAEKFPASEAMSTVRKAQAGYEAVGVISTNAGIVLGSNVANGVPVAFSGRVPVKVTTENGAVKQGDYLTVSATLPGYAMKLTGEGRAIGIALSSYEDGREKVLMLVDNSNRKLDLEGKNATTTGMLTTGNVDLNANGVAIVNIKALASANGTWSIDENGRIVAKVFCLEDVCIDKATLTNILNVSGQGSVIQSQGVVAGTSTEATVATSTDTTTSGSSTVDVATSTENSTTVGGTSVDTTAPTISIVGQNSITLTVGDSYIDQGATALDDTDGDITATIVIANTVDTAIVGSYSVNYTATDLAGNTTTVTRVVDVIAPPEEPAPQESVEETPIPETSPVTP
jgi:Domain of unknown function (DUF5011)